MGDVGGAVCFGKQPVVTDAMQAFWQHMDEEAADEFAGGQRHRLVAGRAVEAIVLVLEGDAVLVDGYEAAIGDGHAVGVAGEIAQDLLGSSERSFAVDHPLAVAQRF